MANSDPGDQSRDHPKKPNDPSDNPFITFRRFADQQVNSLIDTVSSIPSAFTSSFTERHRCSWKDEDQRQALERYSRQHSDDRHEEEVGPFDRMFRDMEKAMERGEREFEKAVRNFEEVNNQEYHEQKDSRDSREPKVWYWSWSWPPKTAEEREREKEEWKHEIVSKCQRGSHNWDSPRFPWGGRRHRWLSAEDDLYDEWESFLLHSTYSPLQLERSSDLSMLNTNWRQAYEDLLSETALSGLGGLHIGPLYLTNDRAHRVMNPHEWINQLQRRHESILWRASFLFSQGLPLWEQPGPSNPSWTEPRILEELRSHHEHDSFTKKLPYINETQAEDHDDDANDADSRPQTELDMYARFLDSTSAAGPASVSPPAPPNNEWPETPSILSTLTTTERNTHPDGTVTTKVVLKKRFSDGREESSETFHTTHPDGRQPESSKRLEHPKEEQSKRKGWFWSS